jgi:uncharacterized protein YecT (DUF1311 family)
MMLVALLLAATPDCHAATTQADLNRCASARARQANVALNSAWRRLLATSDPARPAYVAAQRAWIRYRDAECAAEAHLSQGGSMHPMVEAACIADLTEARTQRIRMLTNQDR